MPTGIGIVGTEKPRIEEAEPRAPKPHVSELGILSMPTSLSNDCKLVWNGLAHYDKIVQGQDASARKEPPLLDIIEKKCTLCGKGEEEIGAYSAETGIEAAENFFQVYETLAKIAGNQAH